MRSIIPLFLIIIAAGLFFGVTTGVFAGIDELRLKQIEVNKDLEKAKEVQAKFDTLRTQSSAIGQADLAKLELLLPKSVDTVDLLVQINGIARNSAMTLADVKIKTEEAKAGNSSSEIAGLGTATFNFSVSGSYGALRNFLRDLERNFRLADVSTISFSAVEKEPYQYNIELKTYWLK